jgi:hypothetical protein
MGAIVAELSTVHEGSYVVRALIQIGNTSFASGMATATDIELAEDQAKIRALQAFGIAASSPQSAPIPYPAYEPLTLGESVAAQSYSQFVPSPALLPLDPLPQDSSSKVLSSKEVQHQEAFKAEVEVNPMTDPAIALPSEPSLADSLQNLAEFNSIPSFNLSNPGLPPLESPPSNPDSPEIVPLPGLEFDNISEPEPPLNSSPEPELPPAKPEKSAKRKTEPKPSTEATDSTEVSESGDRSNEIARIGVEMKRLSWTTEQGRGYLKRTYGKRSRQELDDIELLDFLRFLEAQPSPSQTLF